VVYIQSVFNTETRSFTYNCIPEPNYMLSLLSGGGSGFMTINNENSQNIGSSNGQAKTSLFNQPNSFVYSSKAKSFYIADTLNHQIRQITLNTSLTTSQYNTNTNTNINLGALTSTLCGNLVIGIANGYCLSSNSVFNLPSALAINPAQNRLYIIDGGNLNIRIIHLPDPTSIQYQQLAQQYSEGYTEFNQSPQLEQQLVPIITTLAGTPLFGTGVNVVNGDSSTARFAYPQAIECDLQEKYLYYSEGWVQNIYYNYYSDLRRITIATGYVQLLTGMYIILDI